MIQLTKIFRFEMAHAIHGYPGQCKNIHGHSYELEVCVAAEKNQEGYIPAPGFVIDFKEIKNLVKSTVIEYFDHKLVLSNGFLRDHPPFATQENLLSWDMEPTAENLLIYIRNVLSKKLPADLKLIRLKLFETKDSCAEWICDETYCGKPFIEKKM